MSDLLPEEQATVETYNKVAKIWSTKHHQHGFWEQEMRRFKELLPSGKILDVGSGGARDAHDLIALGYQYTGTDISDSLLTIARKELPNQKFYKQSVYKLSFPADVKFDGFWCSATLLHIPKRRIKEALASIKTVIKPGATGFISIKDGKGERLEEESWENGGVHKRFFSYWSREDFTRVLEANSYGVVDYIYRPMSEKTKWHSFFVKTL